MLVFIAAVTTALVVSFLCSIFESVLLSIRPAQVEMLVARGQRSGQLLKKFKQEIDVPIAAILIVNTIAHTIGATVAGASYANVFDEQTLWVFSLVFTVAVLLLTEIIPKTIGVAFANALATPVAYSIQALTVALAPLVLLASKISKGIRGDDEATGTSAEEIRLLTAIGRHEGVVGARAAGIIVAATQLHQLRAADVLVPRNKIVALSADQSPEEVLNVIVESGHSRFPITPTGQLDDISGVAIAKEILLAMRDDPDALDWRSLVREPLVIPHSKPLNGLLQLFRSSRQHMAIVVDEYGGTEGIVTMEDVIEELVGEINDESDQPVDELWPRTDGSVRALASIELRKLCQHLGISLPDGPDFHTLGGLLLSELDRIPVKGDEVLWHDFRLKVLSATKTRANIVEVTRLPSGTSEAE